MKRLRILMIVLALSVVSCTDSFKSNITSYGSKFQVEMYSGGKLVKTWVSSGKVATVDGSDGWEFKDNNTGRFTRVSGNVVITEK